MYYAATRESASPAFDATRPRAFASVHRRFGTSSSGFSGADRPSPTPTRLLLSHKCSVTPPDERL